MRRLDPGQVKSMLGGPSRSKQVKDNGNPGPGAYHEKSMP